MTVLLAFIIVGALAILLSFPPRRQWDPGANLRRRSRAHYDLVMSASNWRPGMFRQREDGRWFNSDGVEGVRVSLEEFMKRDAACDVVSEPEKKS